MTDEKCYPCKQHSGTIADVKTLKDSISKLWGTVAAKISTKMFLSILTLTVTIFSLIIGSLFMGQDRILGRMLTSQDQMISQMTDIKIDVGVIKSKVSKLETNGFSKR